MKNRIIKHIGHFPLLIEKYRGDFPEGAIVLKLGEHRGANRGFGVLHILAEHAADLEKHSLTADETGVCAYVELILTTGAGIYSEFAALRGYHRPMVVYSRVGTVVLERQEIDGETVYSVVTAFARTSPRGVKIGSIPRQDKST